MEMILIRKMKAQASVLGELSVQGKTFLTLENAEYIIPQGTYPVQFNWSPKFHRLLPLLSVPHRKGIRIHAGNASSDTRGCILVGQAVRNANGEFFLIDSRKAMSDLLSLAFVQNMPRSQDITITIKNDPHFTLNYFDEYVI